MSALGDRRKLKKMIKERLAHRFPNGEPSSMWERGYREYKGMEKQLAEASKAESEILRLMRKRRRPR